jgi:hypothetical protein
MDSAKLLISCVGENDELFTSEVLLLFKTIKKFGGNLAANAILVANFVKSIDPTVKQNLEHMGVKVRIVEPAEHARETTSNKIRMLEMDDDYDYDVLIALDCDTAIVRDFSSEINPQFFQAVPSDFWVPQWQKLFSYFNLELTPERFNTTKRNIIPYFSAGVLSIPKQYVKRLRKSWGEHILRLFEYCHSYWLDELTNQTYFFEELALSLAIEKEKIPLKLLTLEMNFSVLGMDPYFRATRPPGPVHILDLQPDNMSPFIIHYHHLYNIDGSLIKTGYKIPDLAIESINELLLDSEANNHIITKKYSESKQQIHIAKDVKVLQKVSLAKQKLIEQRERWLKLRDYWLKRALKDVDVLQNINLGHQKTIEERDAQLKRAIKDVEILQNINLGHQKTIGVPKKNQKEIEEKDPNLNQFQQLIAQNKQLDIEIGRLLRDIDAIHHSISWRMVTPIKKHYDRIFRKVKKKNQY